MDEDEEWINALKSVKKYKYDKFDQDKFEVALERFKKDRRIVLATVQNDCSALEFADDSLKSDKDILVYADYDLL